MIIKVQCRQRRFNGAGGGDCAVEAAHLAKRHLDKVPGLVDQGQQRVDARVDENEAKLVAKGCLRFCQDLCGCVHGWSALWFAHLCSLRACAVNQA